MILNYIFTYMTDRHDVDIDFDYEPDDALLDESWGEFCFDKGIPEEERDDPDTKEAWADEFEDFCKDYCRDAAYDAFCSSDEVAEQANDAIEYARDPYSYYGVSRWDFI